MRLRLRKLDYKWVALSNTTLGTLLAMINSSILLIALPDIFRGIGIDPLQPGNTSYLLWLLLGFLVVLAVLLVSLGRLGDMYGRVRMFNLGFAVFTVFSILLSITWLHGSDAALWLILMRVGQGVGGAMVFANSSAILTDAFPHDERGLALGINSVSMVVGSFFGLVLGGLLAPVEWRLVFLVSVPIGLVATDLVVPLAARARRAQAGEDRLVGQPHVRGRARAGDGRHHLRDPALRRAHDGVDVAARARLPPRRPRAARALLPDRAARRRADVPARPLPRSARSRPATSRALLAAMARGGLQFILIIWLQGIWLPEHGYDFASTPLWAGIYMLPLILGLLIAGPASGWLSDRFGARPFATGGMLVAATSFALLIVLPVDFCYAGSR